jgi:hypothetical protein
MLAFKFRLIELWNRMTLINYWLTFKICLVDVLWHQPWWSTLIMFNSWSRTKYNTNTCIYNIRGAIAFTVWDIIKRVWCWNLVILYSNHMLLHIVKLFTGFRTLGTYSGLQWQGQSFLSTSEMQPELRRARYGCWAFGLDYNKRADQIYSRTAEMQPNELKMVTGL